MNLGAGSGSRIGFSEGAEAAAPFHPKKKPVDAYCACILDQIMSQRLLNQPDVRARGKVEEPSPASDGPLEPVDDP